MNALSRKSGVAATGSYSEDAGEPHQVGDAFGTDIRDEFGTEGGLEVAIASTGRQSAKPDTTDDTESSALDENQLNAGSRGREDLVAQPDRSVVGSLVDRSNWVDGIASGTTLAGQSATNSQGASLNHGDLASGNASALDSAAFKGAGNNLDMSSASYTAGISQNAVAGSPDLIAYNVTLSASTWWDGDVITANWDILNAGGTDAATSQSSLYISTDTTITTADTLLATDTFTGVMSAGEVNNELGTFTLNLAALGLAAGTYYVGAIADDTNVITESDETNNASPAIVVSIQSTPPPSNSPDLIAFNLSVGPTTWTNGDSITATWDIVNIGGASAASSRSSLYISTDSTITTADTLLVTDTGTGTMKAGELNNEDGTFTLNLAALGLSAGTYYVGAIADDTNVINESNEANNASAEIVVTIQSGPPIGGVRQHDFDGNDYSDVLWRNSVDGATGYWAMDNSGFTWKGFGVVATDLEIVATGDIDGNGYVDILWQSTSTGAAAYYKMDSNGPTWTNLGNSGLSWEIVGTGDFNNDDSDSVIWRNSVDGTTGYRSLNNGSPTWKGLGKVGQTWEVAGTGDFDGNGDDDFLWRDTSNGTTGFWAMNNGSIASWKGFGQVGLAWDLLGTGDFDGDGDDDILWRDTSTGTTGYWDMTNGNAGWKGFGSLASNWDFGGAGDFDGDGDDDILWRDNTNGKTGYWEMDNGTAAWTLLGTVGLAWETPAASFDDIFA